MKFGKFRQLLNEENQTGMDLSDIELLNFLAHELHAQRVVRTKPKILKGTVPTYGGREVKQDIIRFDQVLKLAVHKNHITVTTIDVGLTATIDRKLSLKEIFKQLYLWSTGRKGHDDWERAQIQWRKAFNLKKRKI